MAADLLAGLPGSAYSARMADTGPGLPDRARSTLSWSPHRPSATRHAARRHRAPSPPRHRGAGLVAGAGSRPYAAAAVTDGDPAALLGLSTEDGWATTVHRGLAQAAGHQGNAAWAAALLDRHGAASAGTRPRPAAGGGALRGARPGRDLAARAVAAMGRRRRLARPSDRADAGSSARRRGPTARRGGAGRIRGARPPRRGCRTTCSALCRLAAVAHAARLRAAGRRPPPTGSDADTSGP